MSWHPSQADHHDRGENCGDPDCEPCAREVYDESYLDSTGYLRST